MMRSNRLIFYVGSKNEKESLFDFLMFLMMKITSFFHRLKSFNLQRKMSIFDKMTS